MNYLVFIEFLVWIVKNVMLVKQEDRFLLDLMNEHQKFSGPVGKLATFDHHVVSGHNLDFTSSKIFWPEYRDDNRLILESLFIKSNNVFDNNSCSRDLKILT